MSESLRPISFCSLAGSRQVIVILPLSSISAPANWSTSGFGRFSRLDHERLVFRVLCLAPRVYVPTHLGSPLTLILTPYLVPFGPLP